MIPSSLLRTWRRRVANVLAAALPVMLCTAVNLTAQSYDFAIEQAAYRPVNGATLPVSFDNPPGQPVYIVAPETHLPLFGRDYLIDVVNARFEVLGTGALRIDDGEKMVVLYALGRPQYFKDNSTAVTMDMPTINGEGVLVVEWRHVRVGENPGSGGATFQIRLYEESGVIEYHFGPSDAGTDSAFADGFLTGISTSPAGSPDFDEVMWLSGSSAAPDIDTTPSSTLPRVSGPPANGTIYRFTPRVASSIGPAILRPRVTAAPNPSTGAFSVGGLRSGATIDVRDMLGRSVRTLVADGPHAIVDLADAPAGAYMLVVTQAGRRDVVPVVRR